MAPTRQARPRLRLRTPVGVLVVAGVLAALAVTAAAGVDRLGDDVRTMDAHARAEQALTDLRQATTREIAARYRGIDYPTPRAEVASLVAQADVDVALLARLQDDGLGDFSATLRAYESYRSWQERTAAAESRQLRLYRQGLAADRQAALRAAVERDLDRSQRAQREARDSVVVVATLGGVGLGLALLVAVLQWSRAIHRLYRAGYEDRVTGLGNRRALRERLTRAPGGGVVVVDLDDFKDINDTHGHAAGDDLLHDVAERLATTVGRDGFPGRLGSDEFGVVVRHGVDPVAVAERVAATLDHPFTVSGVPLSVSSSIGVALPGERDPFAAADLAMYEAKRSGKDAVRVFTPDLADAAHQRTALRSDLRRALDRGEIWVAYQPIVDLATGRPRWLEALVRWEHPTGGPISPGAFVPLAESIGVIARIDRHVLRRAAQDAAALGVGVSVNVSPRHLAAGGLPEVVDDALDASGLPPGMLLVEVTESALARGDAHGIVRQLEALRHRGVRVAIDDFGTGQSSLARLAELPVDVLKVDRLFIADHTGVTSRELLPVVASLARRLGLTTVVEGIEDIEQLRLVRDLGFDLGQGFLLGRPTAVARDARDGTGATRDELVTRQSLPGAAVIPHPSNTFDDLPEGGRASRR